MSLSRWDEGSDSDHVRGVNRDIWLVGHRKILGWQRARLPRYGREGAVEVRPFPAKKRPCVSEAQGLSGEAMKGNPTTTVILRADESKSSPRATEDLTEPSGPKPSSFIVYALDVGHLALAPESIPEYERTALFKEKANATLDNGHFAVEVPLESTSSIIWMNPITLMASEKKPKTVEIIL